MAVDPGEVLATISEMLRDSAGEFGADAEITPDSTFYGLGLESLDIVALGGRVQAHYGWAVNFAVFAARVDVRKLDEVTLGQMVDFVVASLNDPAARTP